jgi:hypothetical protein
LEEAVATQKNTEAVIKSKFGRRPINLAKVEKYSKTKRVYIYDDVSWFPQLRLRNQRKLDRTFMRNRQKGTCSLIRICSEATKRGAGVGYPIKKKTWIL